MRDSGTIAGCNCAGDGDGDCRRGCFEREVDGSGSDAGGSFRFDDDYNFNF